MNYLYSILFYVFSWTYLFAGTAIISDFDDTIKRSNIPNHGSRMVGNSALFAKLYYDMPVLLREMNKESSGTYIISASPKLIKPLIKSSLKSFKIEYMDVFTRGVCDLISVWPCKTPKDPISNDIKISYKIEKIESVLKTEGTDGLILLGDNVEADHKVYMLAAKRNPGKVKAIYIRKVKEEKLPKGINGFYTAFGVATKEYEAKRLDYTQVKEVANQIIDLPMDEMYRIIAYYGSCPTDLSKFPKSKRSGIEDLANQVNNKVITHCLERKALNE